MISLDKKNRRPLAVMRQTRHLRSPGCSPPQTQADVPRATQDANSGRLDAHSGRLDAHSSRLDAHSSRLDAHSSRLDAHSSRLDRPDRSALSRWDAIIRCFFFVAFLFRPVHSHGLLPLGARRVAAPPFCQGPPQLWSDRRPLGGKRRIPLFVAQLKRNAL